VMENAIANTLVGALRTNESMSRHTSWRVGGPADVWFAPRSREELVEYLGTLEADVPIHWVGLGSNLLVRDGGIRGVVIAVSPALGDVTKLDEATVEAGAGVACTVLARKCVRWALGPAEFFAGIPGTVGGALCMNAGAFGGETWDRVIEVDVINRRGEVRTLPREHFKVGYRHVEGLQDEWFLAARFGFTPDYETSMDNVRGLIRERRSKQPLGLPSCGSVFRNPPDDHAARLIETAGLKEFTIGGAQVSPKHANFIINTGEATAADIERLIGHVQATVEKTHGVLLEKEVHVLGEENLSGANGGEQ
jgi:UDP-N-acetylmuramate dehydrogenase